MTETRTRSHCRCPLACALPQDGGAAAVDKAAEKHTRQTGHPTVTVTEPAKTGAASTAPTANPNYRQQGE